MDWLEKLIVTITALVLAALIGIVVYAIVTDDSKAKCETIGGHQVTTSSNGIDVTTGKPVIIWSTFCLSADGRILEP